MTLWEIDIHPATREVDRTALRVAAAARELGLADDLHVAAARTFLVQAANLDRAKVERLASELVADLVVETPVVAEMSDAVLVAAPERLASYIAKGSGHGESCVTVLLKPGVMDPVAQSTLAAAADLGVPLEAVSTARKYWFAGIDEAAAKRIGERLLANDAIEQVVVGPLPLKKLDLGQSYQLKLHTVAIRTMDDDALVRTLQRKLKERWRNRYEFSDSRCRGKMSHLAKIIKN